MVQNRAHSLENVGYVANCWWHTVMLCVLLLASNLLRNDHVSTSLVPVGKTGFVFPALGRCPIPPFSPFSVCEGKRLAVLQETGKPIHSLNASEWRGLRLGLLHLCLRRLPYQDDTYKVKSDSSRLCRLNRRACKMSWSRVRDIS